MPTEKPELFRFDVYEFVAATGELYRKGHRLRLSEQQARLLVALLENGGEVVTRQEIRALLWPQGEYLDHDHAIRNTINQLRAVFRDKPYQPRFIETLPKRGYRFVAEVHAVSSSATLQESVVRPELSNELAVTASPVQALVPIDSSLPLKTLEAVKPVGRIRRLFSRPRVRLAAGTVTVLLAGTAYVGYRLGHRSAATVHASPGVIVLGIAPIEASGPAAQQLVEPFRLELMDAASQLPGVEVRAAHSFPGNLAMENVPALARKLQLDALLVGRIESTEANSFSFNFELVRGGDAVHLASFHSKGTAGQLEATRDQIQRELFLRIGSVTGHRLKPLRSTDNPAAYSDYLSGRAELVRHDDAAIHQAASDFSRAIDEDPSFAQAYAGLGSAYLLQGEHATSGRETAYDASRTAAVRAISLNPDLGEAHATLGFLDFRHDWNPVASEVEFKKAIELEPNQAMHRILYALLLCNTGRSAQALDQIAHAHAADPLWPSVYITEMYVASAARRNDLAIETAHKLIGMRPNWPLAHDQGAWALWYAGRHEDAVQEWIQMAELDQDPARIELEEKGLKILRRQGVVAYSRFKLHAIEQGGKWNHPNDFQPAEWQLNAGKDADALTSLRQMVREHDPEVLQFAASPAYLRLQNNPDFQALLKQVGLPFNSR